MVAEWERLVWVWKELGFQAVRPELAAHNAASLALRWGRVGCCPVRQTAQHSPQ